MSKRELIGMTAAEVAALAEELGEKPFRAKQIYAWAVTGTPIDEMSNLSLALRTRLKETCVCNPVTIERSIRSKVDDTEKFLYALLDGNVIEGVLMRYHHGDTLCLSTQVGCGMGCAFCASTLEGCVRSLTVGELVGQVAAVNRHIAPEGRRIHNIVLMGSGEPLANYDNVVAFFRQINAPEGLNLSLRNVSLSTCGLVERIRALADEGLPVTLSVSLHAPNDTIRQTIMPVAHAYAMGDLLAACRYYIEKTGRRVIFEYALIHGVNTRLADADELADRLRGMQCHVNLIPLNDVPERHLQGPDRAEAAAFLRQLERRKISATFRREMGDDIQGACGQLRRSYLADASDAGRGDKR